LLGVPTDYLTYLLLGGLLLTWSFLGRHPEKQGSTSTL